MPLKILKLDFIQHFICLFSQDRWLFSSENVHSLLHISCLQKVPIAKKREHLHLSVKLRTRVMVCAVIIMNC